MTKKIAIKDVRIDGGTQQRPIDDEVISRYRGLLQDGIKFPPIEVMFDGKNYWLVDGYHRWHSYRKAGKNTIQANVTEGTKRAAQWESFSANSKHGLPRQKGTVKAMLIEKIFPDPEWSRLSDADIADWIGGVTRRHVSKCREDYKKAKSKASSRQDKSRKGSTSPNDSEPENDDSSSGGSEDEEPQADKPVLDTKGVSVPEHLQEVFLRADEIKTHITYLNQMVRTIKEAQAHNDLLWVNCKIESLKSDVGNLRRSLKFSLPYAVCPYCAADINNQDCLACNGHGFLNELQYTAAPKEMKE